MESHPYTKPRGVGPVNTQLTTGADPASCPLRGSPQAHPAHGPVHQPAERGANPLCHLLQIQPARVRAVLAARAIRVRAVLAARAMRVRALLGARAIIVEPHPPPFYTSSLTSPLGFQIFAPGCMSRFDFFSERRVAHESFFIGFFAFSARHLDDRGYALAAACASTGRRAQPG